MRLVKYALIRLAVFFVVWAACMLLQLGWIFSTIVAAVIALAVGYLFFNDLRTGASQDVANAWQGRGGRDRFATEQEDMDAEDAYTEGRYFDAGASAGTDPEDDSGDGKGDGSGDRSNPRDADGR
ncbi:DUF4229 domain-containing protein [Citricoccus sp. GCM10030269]|uniref:DUF4229 domain-containing protein n=1 Tax=Citricoccus sp. GCM10030269 TaxID=3273388 RepID=UPI00361A7661